MKFEDYTDYTDKELIRSWNYLETLKLSYYVESKMDAIDAELKRRGVTAWDNQGKILYDL